MSYRNHKKRGSDRRKLNSAINVTPFVDVMLVLLIVFMVSMPSLMTSVYVSLPKVGGLSPIQLDKASSRILVSVTKDGDVWVNDEYIKVDQLLPYLKQMFPTDEDRSFVKLSVKADKGAEYGSVISVATRIAKAGFVRVSLLLDLE